MSIENQRPALLSRKKNNCHEKPTKLGQSYKNCAKFKGSDGHKTHYLKNGDWEIVRSPPVESVVVFGGQGQHAV